MDKKKWLSSKPRNFGSDVIVMRPSVRPHYRVTNMTWHTLEITLYCIPRFWRMVTRVLAETTKVKNSFIIPSKTIFLDNFKLKKKY